VKIGIVGLGYWGKKVFKEYLALADQGMIDSIHLYDTQTSLLSDGIFQSSRVLIHDSYQSMIESVDTVHICIPNNFHYEYTLRSIEAGVSTMVEKPLTKNSTEAFNLVEQALAKGVVLQVGNIFRFSTSLRIVREMIKNGTIGSVNHISILWTHMAPSDNSKAEDVLWDLGPHILDILNFLTGSWPVSTEYNPYKGVGVKEGLNQIDLILNYGSFTSSIRMSLVDHRRARVVDIVGTLGTVILDPVNQSIEIHNNEGIKHIEVEKNNTLRDEIVNFIECSRNGKTKINSGNLGAAIVRELEQIHGARKK
jgi:predicted dehydrogenase